MVLENERVGIDKLHLGYEIRNNPYKKLKTTGDLFEYWNSNDLLKLIEFITEHNSIDYFILPIHSRTFNTFSDLMIDGNMDFSNVEHLLAQQAYYKSWLNSFTSDYISRPIPLNLTVRYDRDIPSTTWSSCISFSMSPWLILDYPSLSLQEINVCEEAFQQQLSWASYCGVYSLILPCPAVYEKDANNITFGYTRYCRMITQAYSTMCLATRLCVRIPLMIPSIKITNNKPVVTKYLDGWVVWNMIQKTVGNPALTVCLELTQNYSNAQDLLCKWIAEPVHAVILPDVLYGNKKLPIDYITFLKEIIKHQAHIIVSSATLDTEIATELGWENFGNNDTLNDEAQLTLVDMVKPIADMYALLPSRTEIEEFEHPCLDKLQYPLQPLKDNLESQTYEVFEKDAVKYSLYENAILKCLKDRINLGKLHHEITIVGAGRGQLVSAAITALRRAQLNQTEFTITALEKNPNAIIILKSRREIELDDYWRKVLIVEFDMRQYKPMSKTNILISELLGSFGDNELCPECLDGTLDYLSDDAISIPSYYYSSIEPISTPKLWFECANMERQHGNVNKAYETLHVVRLYSIFALSKERAQKCFEFWHPSHTKIRSNNKHNERYTQLTFTATDNSVCHGCAGYFHCVLYQNITMSIHPQTITKDLISWFPIYMPLKKPILLKPNEQLKLHVWRCTDNKQVWYEWFVSEVFGQQIHNSGGASHAIAM